MDDNQWGMMEPEGATLPDDELLRTPPLNEGRPVALQLGHSESRQKAYYPYRARSLPRLANSRVLHGALKNHRSIQREIYMS